jgi:hypothetical protein
MSDKCVHNRNPMWCCECEYGTMKFPCMHYKDKKCELTDEKCDYKSYDRQYCDYFDEGVRE